MLMSSKFEYTSIDILAMILIEVRKQNGIKDISTVQVQLYMVN